MPVKAPPPLPVFSWTGCYIGGNLGGGRAQATASGTVSTTAFSAKGSGSGFVGGGQLGCDYQAGNLVFGVEGMWDGTDTSASVNTLGVITNTNLNSFETFTGRIGWAMDRSLLYVKGGGAWVQYKQGLNATALGGAIDSGISKDINGWDLGVGWEYAFAPNWSAKIEYNYMRFRDTSIFFPNNGVTAQITQQSLQTILVGLNYRFDWGKSPVVAKY
jgi:outer membrane immunogenic protein